MTQTWDPQSYEENGAFVPALAGGVLEWLNAKSGERILDLGCGDGRLSAQIAAAGAAVDGIDASSEMVRAARLRGVEANEGRAEVLPYASGTFDAVFSNAVLHWVEDQDAMISEVRRVLKPGGRFVVEMGGHGNIAAVRIALAAVLEQHGLGDREAGANYFPAHESYKRRLEEHGFQVERIALIPRPTLLPASGMKGWLRTFRRGVLETLPEDLREAVVAETSALLAPVLRDENGNWTADYVRLRFIAIAAERATGEPSPRLT